MNARRVMVACATLLATAVPAEGLSGDLDPTFSGDGRAILPFPGEAQARAVAMQGAKIVLGGTQQGSTPTIVLTRLLTGGAVDSAFGKQGKVNVGASAEGDWLEDLLVLPDEKILAAGGATVNGRARFLLVRLLPDGRLDRTFGGDGIVTTRFPEGPASIEAVTLMPDGMIVAGGSAGEYPIAALALARYLPDGRLDRSFSGDGLKTVAFPSRPYAYVDDLVPWRSPADHLLIVGTAFLDAEQDVAIVSLEPDGRLDRDFGGGDGKALFHNAQVDRAAAVILQDLGHFVVVGTSVPGGEAAAMLVRFNASGHVDYGWGSSGVVIHDTVPGSEIWRTAVKTGRKIVIAGGFASAGGLIRFGANGALDTDFGTGSVAVVFPEGGSGFSALAVQPDGRLVPAGYVPDGSSIGFAVARVLP